MRKANRKVKRQAASPRLLAGLALIVVVLLVGGVYISGRAAVSAVPKISPQQYTQQYASAGVQHLLIDVRTPDEFATEHIAGAINISLQTLSDHLSEIPRDQPVILYCHSGNRSAQAAAILNKAGYTNIYDMGGILQWTAAGLPTIK